MLKPFGNRWSALTIILLLTISCGGSGGEAIPKSIILIIADGMGIGQHTMSYYYNDRYAPAAFDHVGLMATHPADRTKVTDSAAGGTAIAAGVKTNRTVVGLDENNQPVKSVLEFAMSQGMATGLITTTAITDATPAAFAAHVPSRYDPHEIARQMAAAGITVLFGGGRQYFLSQDDGGEQEVNLLAAMVARDVQIINSLDDPIDAGLPVVGLFAMGDMPDAPQRTPSLTEMALKAVDILDDDPDGFFLMVEEEGTDERSHANEFDATVAALASLNDLIDAMLAYQKDHPSVLVMLVADHETGGWMIREKEGGLRDPYWGTRGHTGNLVPIFATGPGGAVFDGVVDNTFIGQTLIDYVTAQ